MRSKSGAGSAIVTSRPLRKKETWSTVGFAGTVGPPSEGECSRTLASVEKRRSAPPSLREGTVSPRQMVHERGDHLLAGPAAIERVVRAVDDADRGLSGLHEAPRGLAGGAHEEAVSGVEPGEHEGQRRAPRGHSLEIRRQVPAGRGAAQ